MAEKVDTVVYDMIQKVEEQNASSSWFWYIKLMENVEH